MKYTINYSYSGTIEVDADNKEQAEDIFMIIPESTLYERMEFDEFIIKES